MASNKAQRRQRAAAKKKRRAARQAKNRQAASPHRTYSSTEDFLPVPVWDYDYFAALLVKEEPAMTHAEYLNHLQDRPIRLDIPGDSSYSVIAPAEVDNKGGLPRGATIKAFTELHQDGEISWDPVNRAHVYSENLAAGE
ncbi:hypothetical protein [Corynebacterium lubricantis]|uniref:hypothetical protein n=1 Tax=Corynebacterium lubricantis TaxID=541095 RepID=UPI000374A72A|nr:hypothetical protein [Corynebacterium lubricantis]